MTFNGCLQIGAFFILLLLTVKPLGAYLARVYEGAPLALERLLGPVERWVYRLSGVRPHEQMEWKTYAISFLLFSSVGMVFLYALQRLQAVLPLNPGQFGPIPPDLAFNTSVSYVTNTNWQAYSGETTMAHLTQMLGLTSQNFVSAASGMALLAALIRGFARRGVETVGNFWVDLVRSSLYVLLPLAVVASLILISQGGVQTLDGSRTVLMLQPAGSEGTPRQQIIAMGPAATQVISRDIGTSGGGFFNANSAHPYESPTPLSDFLLLLMQTVVAASLTYTYGKMVGDTRQGWAILAVMLVILGTFVGVAYYSESIGNPRIATLDVDLSSTDRQPGGNMEGKEVRFGIARTALVATVTTATSTGAPNGMHDSLMPLGGLVTLVMMQTGEVILGGVGSGLGGMLILVIVATFIAGLMIGRTPEYLGKKLEPYDIKMASLIFLIMPVVVLGFAAVAVATDAGKASIFNPGPHGLTEVLYAYTSMGNNNGSAFAGLNANTPFYHLTGGVVMLIGRVWIAIPTLALAGSLARKNTVHVSEGSLPTHTPVFAIWLIVVVLGMGAISFFPVLALGPLVEYLLLFG
jgi:K+-transporting ATPase ATPase A chain